MRFSRLWAVGLFPIWYAPLALAQKASPASSIEFSLKIADSKTATPEDKGKLLKLLGSKDQDTVGAAALALRALGDASPDVLAALAKNLDAGAASEATRSVCAFTLMSLGEPGQAVLRERAKSGPLLDRVAAITALRANLAGLKDPQLRAEMATIFKEIEAAANPLPFPPAEGSPITDGGFVNESYESDWAFGEANGGKGRVSFDAAQSHGSGGSLKLEKLNAEGDVYLRSVRPMLVKAGEAPMVRIFFRGDDAPATSLLQVMLERKNGSLSMGDPVRGWVPLAQSLLRNLAPGEWSSRFVQIAKSSKDEEYQIRIVLRGNPSVVWIDDVGAPAPKYLYAQSTPTETMRESGTAVEPTAPTTAEVRREGDRSRLVLNGEVVPPILYSILRSSFGDYAGMEQLAKIRLLVSAVPFSDIVDSRYPPAVPVWKKSGEFDFTTPLKWLDDAANKAPESRFVLNLQFCWPKDWVDAHPEDAWQDSEGQRGYGTGVHFKGFASTLPTGTDPRLPAMDAAEYRWWPSPFSERALQDAEEGIKKFVEILKTKPYANRVVGAHISGGHDYQFMTANWPDYSASAVAAFRAWLSQRYSSDTALQAAWGDKAVTLASVGIPDFSELVKLVAQKNELFLDPIAGRRFVEYQQFQAEQGLVIRERLAGAFKKAWERPAFAMTWQMGGGRGQGVENVMLPGTGIDMLVPQPYYGIRLPGQIGGLRSTALTSFAQHGKLAIKELDLRTWLRMSGAEVQAHYLGAAMNPEEFREIFRREAAQMIASGQGYWFLDLATTGFRDPEMMESMADGDRAYRELEINNPTPVRPDVAMVWVDESPYWMADYFKETSKLLGGSSVNILQTLERFTSSTMKQSGVIYDDIYLSDLLKNTDIQKYKVLVFPDAFRLTNEQREKIREKFQKDGRTLVWNYAAGYVGDEKLSDDAVSKLTGILVKSEPAKLLPKVRFSSSADPLTKGLDGVVGSGEAAFIMMSEGVPDWKMPKGFRRFVVTDSEAVPLAKYSDGKTAVAVRRFLDWTSVYFGMLGTQDAALFHRIAKDAGALVLTEPSVAVEFNGRFLSLHGLKNGPTNLRLPFGSVVYDFDTNQEVGRGRDITLKLNAGETRWFRVEKTK